MISNVPFLTYGCSDNDVPDDMELASAFLFFSTVEPEKIMGLFPKQGSEKITCVARGFYPLYGYYLEEEGKLCIYDRLCNIGGELEVEDVPDMALDFDELLKSDFNERAKAVRGAVSDVKRKSSAKMPAGSLMMGYENLQDILKGRDLDSLASSTISLESYVTKDEPDKFQVEAALSRLRLNINSEIETYKKLCNFDGDNFKSYIREKSGIYDNHADEITGMERKTGENIGKLLIEKEEKVREAERLYGDREEYIAGDCLLNKNKSDIAQITGSEVELDLYQANISDSEEKINKVRKELQEEIKSINEQYDNLVEAQKSMLSKAIKNRDDAVSRYENAYNELHRAVEELKQAVKDDICRKRDRIEEIIGFLAGLDPDPEGEPVVINIPFYIAELKGKNARYQLFFPVSMKEKSQVKSIITEMAGKISLPFEVRDRLFEDLHGRLVKWLEDPEHKEAINMFKQKNLAAFEGMHENIENGLSEMFTRCLLSDKSLDRSLVAVRSAFSNQ